MNRLFGTDGVRGVAGEELTAELAYKLGIAAAVVMFQKVEKPIVAIGKDTRLSGDMFEAAMTAAFCSMGVQVVSLGVVPTPAVAFIVKQHQFHAGIMISASHNPAKFNGIKFFSDKGYKIPDQIEEDIEAFIFENKSYTVVKAEEIGSVLNGNSYVQEYIEHVKTVFDENKPSSERKIRVLFDLSCGSACSTAKSIFDDLQEYGIFADYLSDTYNGININDKCGSTHMERLSQAVCEGKYDIGIAFDGDADRCLAVDEKGNEIDGDYILSLFAINMKEKGVLSSDTLVVTMLSNLGLHFMAKENAISVKVTDVGDRYVLQEMVQGGYSLGGEQSGHIILNDYATTGDGQITGAKILSILCEQSGRKTSEIFSCMKKLPQVSVNVNVPNSVKYEIAKEREVLDVVEQVEYALNGIGRVLLRPSGTEPKIRIMLEGKDSEQLYILAEKIKQVIDLKVDKR